MKTTHTHSTFGTFCLVAGSSILFCSKSVFAKMAYAHGVDAITVLALRMAFALPLFAGLAIFASRGAAPLTGADWARMAGLGFVGYYISSLVNFTGLQYVSVGLERIILYTYPSLVLAYSALVLRTRIRPVMWAACAAAWVGIVAAFAGEMHNPIRDVGRTGFGAVLIFISAMTYATFIMLSGSMIQRVGAMRFTGIAVGFSCLFILAHYGATHALPTLARQPAPVYGLGIILAVFGTFAPSVLLSLGLRRAGPQKFAIISTVGPVATLFLAWLTLGEHLNAGQAVGFVLTLGGGLMISVFKEKPPQALRPTQFKSSNDATSRLEKAASPAPTQTRGS